MPKHCGSRAAKSASFLFALWAAAELELGSLRGSFANCSIAESNRAVRQSDKSVPGQHWSGVDASSNPQRTLSPLQVAAVAVNQSL